jgi:hypothetical protein
VCPFFVENRPFQVVVGPIQYCIDWDVSDYDVLYGQNESVQFYKEVSLCTYNGM